MNTLKILTLIAVEIFSMTFISTASATFLTQPSSGSGTSTDPYILNVATGGTVYLGDGNDYYWSHNGQPIIQGGTNVLAPYYEISNAQLSDGGPYSGTFSQGGSIFYQVNVNSGVPTMPRDAYVILALLLFILVFGFLTKKRTFKAN